MEMKQLGGGKPSNSQSCARQCGAAVSGRALGERGWLSGIRSVFRWVYCAKVQIYSQWEFSNIS